MERVWTARDLTPRNRGQRRGNSDYSVSRLRFQPTTFRVRSRSVTDPRATFGFNPFEKRGTRIKTWAISACFLLVCVIECVFFVESDIENLFCMDLLFNNVHCCLRFDECLI